MRIEKWETAVDIKGALDKLPKMATGGMILAVINDVLKNVQYAPTTGALTDEEWKSIADAGSDTIYRWPRMRQAINTVLSRRTAEPQPSAEPSPAPFGCGGDLMSMAEAKEIASHAPVPAPSGDVIGEMLDAAGMAVGYYSRECMTAAYAVARAHMLEHPPAEWLEKRDAEWWRKLGSFRKALEDAGLNGHYNLFQEHFGDDPQPKQERVTVEVKAVKNTETLYEVHAGDSHVFTSADEIDAERYAAGLRAELKGAGE
jgi:hypothetical protein